MINRKKLMRNTQADHHKSPPIKKKDMTGEEIEKWSKSTGGVLDSISLLLEWRK
jgi:hypothetical protein